MNILWLSWKDIKHPQAGGAEFISNQLMQRLAEDGHSVRLITSRYPGSSSESTIGNVKIYRSGGRFGVYYRAFRLFRKTMKDWPDLIIDEMNTMPFGAAFYTRKKVILLTYQLARQVWFYQMIFPFSLLGYSAEPIYLFIMSRRYKLVLTESESTKLDLAHYGFSKANTHVFRVGIELVPLKKLSHKKSMDSLLILGAVRPMKRTLSAIKAFEYARDSNSRLRLTIAGDNTSDYAKKVAKYIDGSRHRQVIEYLGKVNSGERLKLMRESAVILVTSIKEGWGLIVTEANSQGTPAIVYNSDGLRDSVINTKTGIMVKSGDELAMGRAINQLLSNQRSYELVRRDAWESSKNYSMQNSYDDFTSAIGLPATIK